jgi:hypothetical protein
MTDRLPRDAPPEKGQGVDTTLLIADYARVADGKLDLVGAGWTVTGPGPVTFGVGILFQISWDEANRTHRFVLDLLDADGNPMLAPDATQPLLHADGDFETGRPVGLKPGMSQHGPVALNVAGMPLPSGQTYQLRLVVNGDEDEASTLSFSTRPEPRQQAAA